MTQTTRRSSAMSEIIDAMDDVAELTRLHALLWLVRHQEEAKHLIPSEVGGDWVMTLLDTYLDSAIPALNRIAESLDNARQALRRER